MFLAFLSEQKDVVKLHNTDIGAIICQASQVTAGKFQFHFCHLSRMEMHVQVIFQQSINHYGGVATSDASI